MAGLNSPSRAEVEQDPNGVLTGFSHSDLCYRLDEVACKWRESDRLDVLLLRALCRLSSERDQDASSGFTSADLVAALSRLHGKPWSNQLDPERMSDDVRRYWGKLQETWSSKLEGIRQHAIDDQWAAVPQLAKTEGGGAGRQSRYRLEWVQGAAHVPSSVSDADQDIPIAGPTIRYVCEDIDNPGVLVRVFARGFFLVGWRRWAFVALLGGPMLLLLALFSLAVFQLTLRHAFGITPAANNFVAFAVLFAVFLPTLGAFFMAPQRKIVVAPWWLQSVDDDRLLEHRSPPRYPEKSLKIARYTAVCPICRGTVTARSGGLEFFSRIVGRCENSPQEHIFSFDHVTRRGKALR